MWLRYGCPSFFLWFRSCWRWQGETCGRCREDRGGVREASVDPALRDERMCADKSLSCQTPSTCSEGCLVLHFQDFAVLRYLPWESPTIIQLYYSVMSLTTFEIYECDGHTVFFSIFVFNIYFYLCCINTLQWAIWCFKSWLPELDKLRGLVNDVVARTVK